MAPGRRGGIKFSKLYSFVRGTQMNRDRKLGVQDSLGWFTARSQKVSRLCARPSGLATRGDGSGKPEDPGPLPRGPVRSALRLERRTLRKGALGLGLPLIRERVCGAFRQPSEGGERKTALRPRIANLGEGPRSGSSLPSPHPKWLRKCV
ncbi:hypothetical protein MLD38_000743 [Melastoma candidum]|uniref:Uncharacterized protein n=1 Tax=Melastoma candidum TaxID=119954 RepID=A0ACB9SEE1_9MYRT|nr:hypothetical protein MLD38_000743 [Melastoma candidum]